MTLQPTSRQHDPINSTNTKPWTQRQSQGGGRVKLRATHVDAPISFTTTHDTRPNTPHDNPTNTQRPNNKHHEVITVTMVQKSTRSLTSDDRIHELTQELRNLKDSHWDSVTINETQRKEKEELWTTRQGHTLAATGNSQTCRGTAILFHKRWTKHIKELHHSGPSLTGVSIEKKMQTTSLLSLLPSHVIQKRTSATNALRAPEAH